MIPFNIPLYTGLEDRYIRESIESRKLSGDGPLTQKCHQWFRNYLNTENVLLVPSCTHALEMAAILLNIEENDEVIMPSYTFVSTANAFVLRGAKVIFVDIRPDTMNIDENKIEKAITNKTKAIVAVHYAGVGCEMDTIVRIAKKHSLYLIEDAAQGMMSSYNGRSLGTIGDLGAYSFHETKNYTSGGEGGLLIVNNPKLRERANIIREKGTNKNAFSKGIVDKYSWVDVGSSYLLSELNAAYLYGQLKIANKINEKRLEKWEIYNDRLRRLEEMRVLELPVIPNGCCHNAHMFYIKVKDLETRLQLMAYLKSNNIACVFHYIPLHTSPAGVKFGRFSGEDKFTTIESERIIRLPMYYDLTLDQIEYISDKILEYFKVAV